MNIKNLIIIITLFIPLLLISPTITFNQALTLEFAAATTTKQTWITYSGDGIIFEYPSTWRIENVNTNESTITVFNPSSIENSINIGLPSQSRAYEINQYSSIQEWADNTLAKSNVTTIIEPFTDKIINGYPAAMGELLSGNQKTTMAIIIHNGQIYTLSYSDTPDKYDTFYSQAIMQRLILSFNID